MVLITTVSDLRTYLNEHYGLSPDEVDHVADVINRRVSGPNARPNYGDDWSNYLDALTMNEVAAIVAAMLLLT